MKVAIVHYWIVNMRGGERVLEALCRMFPDADIFTHVYDPHIASDIIRCRRVTTTFIARLPLARRFYQSYLPLMPLALEELDLAGYDLIISSESGPAKGVIPPPGAAHLCYAHSPMRYIWDQYHVYKRHAGLLARMVMPALAHKLRIWDVSSAARVDAFLANSTHVASRVKAYYRRAASVVHPPVAVDDFVCAPRAEREPFYLWVGELVSYKRPDLAVEAFNKLRRPLVVIGEGPMRARLERMAGDHIRFLGKADFETLKWHLSRCQALIFPGEEDFGIVPVEAMASGRPVIAYGRGGVLDTIRDGETGLLFYDQTTEGLVDAVERFEASAVADAEPALLRAHARLFDETAFRRGVFGALAKQGRCDPSLAALADEHAA